MAFKISISINHINGSPKETKTELAKVRSMLRHGVTDFTLKFFSAWPPLQCKCLLLFPDRLQVTEVLQCSEALAASKLLPAFASALFAYGSLISTSSVLRMKVQLTID